MKTKKPGIAIKIALGVFVIFFLVTIFKLKIDLDTLGREYAQLQAKVEESEAYVKKLENLLASEFDEEYVEGVAKDKLNLVLPDEIIFYNDIAG